MLSVSTCAFAQKRHWVICDLTVMVKSAQDTVPRVSGLVRSSNAPAGTECPAPGAVISFLPETMDYQTVLPRKQWPGVGEVVTIRYRYLLGECKYTGPCKIEHFSLMR
ncbi:hypothetical protein GCM10025770_06010 [Viridibacterium curvum]|uniref:Uncharacterized protein n=2 Tax=Viridibacterium curvum TaxID=1101404 RepID=A0ABP9QCF1_9RHOO